MQDKDYFVVTEDHLKLLRHAYTRWDDMEYGAPCIDPKRPYGNSNVEADIAEILDGIGQSKRDAMDNAGTLEAFENKHGPRYRKIHEETQTALEIALRVGYFKAGPYIADKYTRNWRPAHLEPGALVRLGAGTIPYRVLEVFPDREVALIVRHNDPEDDEPFAANLSNLFWYSSE